MKGEKLGRRDFVKAATLFATGFPTILVALPTEDFQNRPHRLRWAWDGCCEGRF
jgi:hypothetical protein